MPDSSDFFQALKDRYGSPGDFLSGALEFMQEKGISQRALSRKSGLHPSYLSRTFLGRHEAQLKVMLIIDESIHLMTEEQKDEPE